MSRSETAWSYRPGGWLAVVGATATVLLPEGERERAARLWESVDAGADLGTTLDQVLASGLRGLPAFVLVGSDGDAVRVIVRGEGVRVRATTAEGDVEVDGAGVASWVERTLTGVTALSLLVDDPAEGEADEVDVPAPDAHRVDAGLVRVSRMDRPPLGVTGTPAAPAPVAAQVVAPVAEPAPVDVPAPSDEAEQADDAGLATELMDLGREPAVAPVVVGGQEASPLDDDADTSSVAHPGLEPVPADDAGWPAPPAVPPPGTPPTVPPPAPAGDHDGMTRAGGSQEEHDLARPGIPGQPPAPSVTRPVATLAISSGERVEVDRVVLIGRAPEARRFSATDQPRLVTVPSPLHEISSTHVEVRPGTGADHGSAVVTDMGSTNGTVVVQPGLDPEDLTPGIALQLIPGAVINLGDGVTIQVLDP